MPETPRVTKSIEPVVLTWFFFSGMVALVYQVIWARELELVFGSTLYAVSTILSVFMAGLALGSILFGKIADRHKEPLKLYGAIEVGIGVYAMLTPWLFKSLEMVQQGLPDAVRGGSAGFNPFSFIFSFVILIIPTTLMGGTLPILSKAIIRSYREMGAKVSTLYFINTLGAAAGAFLAGFVFIASFGMIASTFIAALVNVLIGTSAVWVQRLLPGTTSPAEPAGASSGETDVAVEPQISRRLAITLLLGYGFAGFSALGLEVLWTRVLILVIGSSVYAFSLMLTAILMGIALGSILGVKIVDRARNLLVWFAGIEVALGLAVILVTPILGESPLYFFDVFFQYQGEAFNKLLLIEFVIIFLILMVPTTLMGLAFPIASKIYARDLKRLSSRIGDIYAANTIGAIIGPLAVSFVLIPLVGIQKSILEMAYIYLAIGAAIIAGVYWRRIFLKIALAVVMAAIVVAASSVVPAWNKLVITSGVYYQMGSYYDPSGRQSAREVMTDRDLLFYKEGQLATVSVTGWKGQKVLTINGKVDASSTADLGTQLLLAHMPLLVQKDPQKVLAIGLGSGITLGAILKHPEVRRVDMVEIEPAVVEAARFFAEENGNALSDPRTNLVVNDARNFIISTSEKYDVISAEPSNPWVSQSSTMFSQEVFEQYRRVLNEDGVMMQWFHLYRMGNDDLRMIINTFRSAFPHTTLWGKPNSVDIILIGSKKPLTIDFNEFSRRIQAPAIAADLQRIDSNDVFQMLNYFLMDENNLAKFAGQYPANTDDMPRLEFSAPKNLYARTVGINLETMNGYRSNALSVLTGATNPVVRAKIETDFQAREKAIQAQIYSQYGDWERAQKALEDSLVIDPSFKISRESLSDLLDQKGEGALQSGNLDMAFYFFTRAAELTPRRGTIRVDLGRAATASNQPELAVIHYAEAARLSPRDSFIQYSFGNALTQVGAYEEAVDAYNRALAIEPGYAYAYANRAYAFDLMGQRDKALADYDYAITVSPEFAAAYVSRGLHHYYDNNYPAAIGDFSSAVKLAPTANNYDFLALALISAGSYDEALKSVTRAIETDPGLPLPWYRKGLILEQQGKKAEALMAYQHFVTLSTDQSMIAVAQSAISRLQ